VCSETEIDVCTIAVQLTRRPRTHFIVTAHRFMHLHYPYVSTCGSIEINTRTASSHAVPASSTLHSFDTLQQVHSTPSRLHHNRRRTFSRLARSWSPLPGAASGRLLSRTRRSSLQRCAQTQVPVPCTSPLQKRKELNQLITHAVRASACR
jgi:hypothetical protein